MLEPLASALAVLTEDEKELGVALVEMGAGTTDLAVFHEGKIRHLGTIAFGGNNVTSDIVHGLGVTQADAERLKERYGCAYEPLVDPAEVIQLPSTVAQGDRQIPRELLAHIIHQRMDEIFDLVQRDVVSGGVCRKAERRRRADGRRGGDAGRGGTWRATCSVRACGSASQSENIGGLVDSVEAPRFATVVGLAQYGAQSNRAWAARRAPRATPIGKGDGRDCREDQVLAAGFLLDRRSSDQPNGAGRTCCVLSQLRVNPTILSR